MGVSSLWQFWGENFVYTGSQKKSKDLLERFQRYYINKYIFINLW